ESTKGPALSQPALLTTTSMRPNRCTTRSAIACTPWRSVTSARIATAPRQRGHGLPNVRPVHVGDDGRPLRCELPGDRLTDALVGTGHDRDLVVETCHGRFPSSQRPYSRPGMFRVVSSLDACTVPSSASGHAVAGRPGSPLVPEVAEGERRWWMTWSAPSARPAAGAATRITRASGHRPRCELAR